MYATGAYGTYSAVGEYSVCYSKGKGSILREIEGWSEGGKERGREGEREREREGREGRKEDEREG